MRNSVVETERERQTDFQRCRAPPRMEPKTLEEYYIKYYIKNEFKLEKINELENLIFSKKQDQRSRVSEPKLIS